MLQNITLFLGTVGTVWTGFCLAILVVSPEERAELKKDFSIFMGRLLRKRQNSFSCSKIRA